MLVYCIIVTYNGQKWIEKCLESLERSDIRLITIIVDNNSADNTIEIVKNNFPHVILIENKQNLGFGQANNIGIKYALRQKADYIFLLNQDTWINQNTIAQLSETLIAFPEYGILSPFHLSSSENAIEKTFLDFLSPNYTNELTSDMYFSTLKKVYQTSYIHAASWFISAKCILTVGGFDPIYTHYGEDDDYLQRAKYFGFKVGLVPAATIIHDAVYKTWAMTEWDSNRNFIVELQHLKKMYPHFRTNILSYIKSSFDELSTLLLFRKFKKFKFRFMIIWKTIMRIKSIHISYKKSFSEGAFLD